MNREELPPTAPPDESPPEHPRGLMARFRNYFLTGLIVAGPVAITLYLTWWFVNWVDSIVRPFVPTAYRPETYLPFGLPGSGLIVAVIALTLLGFLTANLIGRTLVDLGERLLGRMPVVRAIYRGLKQVFETLFSGKGSSFRRVGLVEFPSPGMWSIVLISQSPSVNIASQLPGEEEHISVFLPCAPNPTTGFFFYVPKSKIIEVEMSTEDAATLIMSAGVVQPGSDPQKRSRRTGRHGERGARGEFGRAAAGAGEGGGIELSRHSRSASKHANRRRDKMVCSAARNDDSHLPRSAARLHRVHIDKAAPQRLAALALQFRIVLHDPQRLVARLRDQLGVDVGAGDAIAGQAALADAEHVAFAAQFQILLGNPKAVGGLADHLQPRLRHLAERLLVEQQAGRRLRAAPDPAAQLVQLREPEALGVLDHHDGRGGDVDADLDHRGRDQKPDLVGGELRHHAVFLGPLHLAMDQTNPVAEALPQLSNRSVALVRCSVPSASDSSTSGQIQ